MSVKISQTLFDQAKGRAAAERLALQTLTAFALEEYLRMPSQFIATCDSCDFRKFRQYFTDASELARAHGAEQPTHAVAVERHAEKSKKEAR